MQSTNLWLAGLPVTVTMPGCSAVKLRTSPHVNAAAAEDTGGRSIVNVNTTEPSPASESCCLEPVNTARGIPSASLDATTTESAAARSAFPIITDTVDVINGTGLLTILWLCRSLVEVLHAVDVVVVSAESQLFTVTKYKWHNRNI